MVAAGIIGAGLVWGWLLVLFVDQRPVRARPQHNSGAEENANKFVRWLKLFLEKWQTERRPYLNLLAVTLFTSGFAWLIYALTDTRQLLPFFISLTIAFSIHFAWRQKLRRVSNDSA